MIIHSVYIASYGKFKNKRITFQNGINYIYGKNEAGKSTVLSFIKAMLYGFSGRGNDRKKYIPWDGGNLSGEMEVSLSDGRRVIISRTAGKIPSQDTFRVIDAVTGEVCDIDLVSEIGIGENAFANTVFIRQTHSEIGNSDEELTNKLINLKSSGDSDLGYNDAVLFLKERIRFYKHQRGNGGHINELKKKITALQADVEEAEIENREITNYISIKKNIENEIQELEKQRTQIQKELCDIQSLSKRDFLDSIQNEKNIADKKRSELSEQLISLEEQYKSFELFELQIDESFFSNQENKKVTEDKIRLSKIRQLVFSLSGSFVLVCCAILLGFGYIIQAAVLSTIIILFFSLLFFEIKFQKSSFRILSEIKKRQEKSIEACNVFDCHSLQDFIKKKQEKVLIEEKIKSLKEEIKRFTKESVEAEKKLEQFSENRYADLSVCYGNDFLNKKETLTRISDKITKKQNDFSEINGFLKVSNERKKSADLLLGELERLTEQLKKEEKELLALELALDTLETVYNVISKDFTPMLNMKATHYFSFLTGRNDEELLIDRNYEIIMGRGEHKDLKYFSGGTIDQAFFAVRLALADMVLKNIPIFLDDSFLQYDEVREKNVILLLEQIAQTKQVFWFSCKKNDNNNMNNIEL